MDLVVHTRLEDHLWIHGSRTLLSRMIDNVVDNAVIQPCWRLDPRRSRGERPGGAVGRGDRRTPSRPRAGQPAGSTVSPLGTERTGNAHGSGLGLSIVSAIATTHGGHLDLRARPEGGLRVAITMPLTTAAAAVPR